MFVKAAITLCGFMLGIGGMAAVTGDTDATTNVGTAEAHVASSSDAGLATGLAAGTLLADSDGSVGVEGFAEGSVDGLANGSVAAPEVADEGDDTEACDAAIECGEGTEVDLSLDLDVEIQGDLTAGLPAVPVSCLWTLLGC